MSEFKVGDTVILTQNEEELSRFTDWAQMLITTKARCMVTSVNERTLRAKVLEGKERGRGVSAPFKRFLKYSNSLDEL